MKTNKTLRDEVEDIISKTIIDWSGESEMNITEATNALLTLFKDTVEKDVIGEDENDRFLSKISVERTRAKNQLRQSQRQALQKLIK